MVDSQAAAQSVWTNGYAVLPSFFPPEVLRAGCEQLEAQWRGAGEPKLYAREDIAFGPTLRVNPVGLCCEEILSLCPEFGELLLHPTLLETFGALLGEGFELELASGIMSDNSRGFVFWHNHVGGIDAEAYRREQKHPQYEQVERVGCTIYGSPLDDDHGVMLVSPRRYDGPTDPPHEPGTEPWPNCRRIEAPAGSVVLFDQGTWHAVTPMERTGFRYFFGFFIRRNGVLPVDSVGPGVAQALQSNPALHGAFGGQR